MLFDKKVNVNKSQAKMYNKGRQLIEEQASLKPSYNEFNNQQIAMSESVSLNRPVGNAALRRRMFKRRNDVKTKNTERLFMENFFDLYKRSLLIDEDFVSRNEGNLYNLCKEVYANLVESGYITPDTIKNHSSNFIQKMYTLCEEIAEKNAIQNVDQDSVKNLKLDDEYIYCEKDEEDEKIDVKDAKKIEDETDEDKENVSEIIKDKVADTIKKEKEISEKEEEDSKEIEEKSKTEKEKEEEKDDEEETDEDDSEEDDENDSEDEEDDSEEETKSESIDFSRRKIMRPNKLRNTSLFRSIQINVVNKFLNEKKNGLIDEDINMNMDLIFAESIAYYTLLETMNTVGMLKLGVTELKNLCKELILK